MKYRIHFEGDFVVEAEDEDEALMQVGLMSDEEIRDNIDFVECEEENRIMIH